MNRKRRSEIVCRCNNIPKDTIEEAIVDGADTLNQIFDCTTAGVGACGGSCRRKLAKMLEQYQKDGTFPETFIDKKKKKRRR